MKTKKPVSKKPVKVQEPIAVEVEEEEAEELPVATVSRKKAKPAPIEEPEEAPSDIPDVVMNVVNEAKAEKAQPHVTVSIVPEPVPEIAIPKLKDGWVRITMFKTIEPPPIIGSFNVGTELNIRAMVERQAYVVPLNIACVLKDSGVAFWE